MINLYGSLPETIELSGREFSIVTDFRDWLKYDALIADDTVEDTEKIWGMVQFYDEIPEDIDEAIMGLTRFYLLGQEPIVSAKTVPNSEQTPKVYDYTQDAALIFAGFMQAYNINLYDVDYMHWWAFVSLLEGLPDDTRFKWVVSIRAADTKKMGKHEREHYTKLKKLCALNDAPKKAQTLLERNKEMINHAKRISQRANMG